MIESTQAPELGIVEHLTLERAIRRRAQRMWRIISVVAGVLLGLLGWGWGAAAFLLFQFLAYATYWHSVRGMEQQLGISEQEQAALLAKLDRLK